MYLKLFGSLFLISSAAAIGFIKAEELNVRVKRLTEFRRMMSLLKGELRFRRAVLSEAFIDVSERVDEPFREFLGEVSEKIEKRQGGGLEAVWSEAREKLLRKEGFCNEDRSLFDILESSLGYLDLAMQTETLNMAMIQAEEAIKKAKEQQESRGRLYRTIGVTVGMLLTLLMI